MSELELSILRQRSLEALKQKARRGELFLTVAIGFVKVRHNQIDMDPEVRECAKPSGWCSGGLRNSIAFDRFISG